MMIEEGERLKLHHKRDQGEVAEGGHTSPLETKHGSWTKLQQCRDGSRQWV